MFQVTCSRCGAIFTTEVNTIPQCLECQCTSKEFQINEIVN
ncbi:MAG: hypothetical protein AABY07_08210 [Nanoarchaeota archaeon]